MGLLDLDTSLQAKKDRQKARIQAQMKGSFNQLVRNYKQAFDNVWNNPECTPQEVLDAFGFEAGNLVTLSVSTAAFINGIIPDSVDPTPPKAVAVNPDGSVTIKG